MPADASAEGRRILLLKTGSTVPLLEAKRGDFELWFAAGCGLPLESFDVVDVSRGEPLPEVGAHGSVIVTGSPALVTDEEPWSEASAAWIADAVTAEVPLLAVCYGHQLLAHGAGGRVGDNPRGREIGTVDLDFTSAAAEDPLFGPWARDGGPRRVQETHVQSVLALPSGAELLASSDLDPHQAFRLGGSAWGVQFHPEFDAEIVRGYLEVRGETIRGEGLDPEAIAQAAEESADGSELLRRFVRLFACS